MMYLYYKLRIYYSTDHSEKSLKQIASVAIDGKMK